MQYWTQQILNVILHIPGSKITQIKIA